MNLIPAHRRAARKRKARIQLWIAGGGAYVLLLAAVCMWSQYNRQDVRKVAAELAAATQQNDLLQKNVNTARVRLADAVAARDTLAVLSDPPDWSLLLWGLSTAVGDDAMLREVHLIPSRAAISPASQPPAFGVSLRGICRSQAVVSQFVKRLQQTRILSNIKLLRTTREQYMNDSVVSFDIDCALGGEGASVASTAGNP